MILMLLMMMMVMMYSIPGALVSCSSLSLSFIFHLLLSTSLLLSLPSFSICCHPEFFPRWCCHSISRMMVRLLAVKLCVDDRLPILLLSSGRWYDVYDDDSGTIIIFSLSLSLSLLWRWLRLDGVSIGVFVDVFVYIYDVCLLLNLSSWC